MVVEQFHCPSRPESWDIKRRRAGVVVQEISLDPQPGLREIRKLRDFLDRAATSPGQEWRWPLRFPFFSLSVCL
jgi:hypothetical protein